MNKEFDSQASTKYKELKNNIRAIDINSLDQKHAEKLLVLMDLINSFGEADLSIQNYLIKYHKLAISEVNKHKQKGYIDPEIKQFLQALISITSDFSDEIESKLISVEENIEKLAKITEISPDFK